MRDDLDPARGIVRALAVVLGFYALVVIALAFAWNLW
jgi:hypothetical protein